MSKCKCAVTLARFIGEIKYLKGVADEDRIPYTMNSLNEALFKLDNDCGIDVKPFLQKSQEINKYFNRGETGSAWQLLHSLDNDVGNQLRRCARSETQYPEGVELTEFEAREERLRDEGQDTTLS